MDQQDFSFNLGSYKVLYVYQINDGRHDGRLKVGDATYHPVNKSLEEIISESVGHRFTTSYSYSTDEIVKAARDRIDQQTLTADVEYELLWTALAVRPDPANHNQRQYFRDYDVHSVLLRSGVTKDFAREDKRSGEWFTTDLVTVKSAFQALCVGAKAINNKVNQAPIVLRSEQQCAVDAAAEHFQNGSVRNPKTFLWNAIMRFGKTLTAYALVKKLEETEKIQKILIMTHRPVVSHGWYEDFEKSFSANSGWTFGSKKVSEDWENINKSKKFFYFASIQDLRGSFPEGDREDDDSLDDLPVIFSKNEEVFATKFDLAIIDEAHEGTQTLRAKKVNDNIKARYKLSLSGTPFNIIDGFEDNVFTWSYIDEQRTSKECDEKIEMWEKDPENNEYPGFDVNPYRNLPKMKIQVFDTSDILKNHPAIDPSKTTFNFSKFFEVDPGLTEGRIKPTFHQFSNVAAVDALLNLMSNSDEHGELDYLTGKSVKNSPSNFPFSRDNSKRDFAHTFWMLPTVEAAIALQERLHVHPNFSEFHVVNATGNNHPGDALSDVRTAIKNHERTITLSVGKLTTGTTVPEWTGVVMLTNMRSPMLYMQTIFRVKSSGSLADGRQKEVGYVFDFDPDRCLEMMHDVAKMSAAQNPEYEQLPISEQEKSKKEEIENLLTYLPVIAYKGGKLTPVDSSYLMKSIERVYIHRAVDSGFSDSGMFKIDAHEITEEDAELTNSLVGSIGKTVKDSNLKRVTISSSKLTKGFKTKTDKSKASNDTVPSVSNDEDELKVNSENAKNIMNLLRVISARVPLLVFAVKMDQDVTLDNLTTIVDNDSWAEFMPAGCTKEKWERLKKFFNAAVFEGACGEFQTRVGEIFKLPKLQQVPTLINLFALFKDPDKETVLTPWKLVSRQWSETLGGLRMIADDGKWFTRNALELADSSNSNSIHSHTWEEIEESNGKLVLDPIWTEVDDDLQKFWESQESTILDINSKTALYAFYGAVSLFYVQKKELERRIENSGLSFNQKINEEKLWREIVENQIFVNCRVPYSRAIAERVLGGYGDVKVNASVIDVIQVRRALKSAKVNKFTQSGGLAKSKRSLTDDEIADIWKWIFNPESMSSRSVDGTITIADERARTILNMAEDKKSEDTLVKSFASFEELLEVVREEKPQEGFSTIVSNPPYSEARGGNGKSVPIWQDFFFTSSIIAKYVSMISPARWRHAPTSNEKNIRNRLIDMQYRIRSISITDPSDTIFPGTLIRDGVGIIFIQDTDSNELPFLKINSEEGSRISLDEIYYNQNALSIFEKIGLDSLEFLNYTYGTGQSRIRSFTKNSQT